MATVDTVGPVPGMPRRPTADTIGLYLAQVWSMRGTCIRRKVGCVLFDVDGHQIGAGYNGPPSGHTNCTEHPCPGAILPSGTGLSTCEAVHAEVNAIARCADVRQIHTVYCTSAPCLDCVKVIANTGASRIVFQELYPHHDAAEARWRRYRPNGEWRHLRNTALHVPVEGVLR